MARPGPQGRAVAGQGWTESCLYLRVVGVRGKRPLGWPPMQGRLGPWEKVNDMTMNLSDILARNGVVSALKAQDKKQVLQSIAERASKVTEVATHDIYTALLQRERLSSTGLGSGIAIPHVKLAGLTSIVCLFARLSTPVAFESHDEQPVDLVFFLLAPEHAGGDHLKALARISRLVRDPATLEALRSAKDEAALTRVLTSPITSHAA